MNCIVEDLKHTELFKGVAVETLKLIAAQATPMAVKSGKLLLNPEIENEYVYIILSGALALYFGSLDSPKIRVIGKGYSVGELSIIGHAKPSAYVIADEDSCVLPLHRDFTEKLIAETAPIANNLLRQLATWLKDNTDYIVRDRSKIGELTNHANTDSLTGLYNRRWLDATLNRLLSQAIETRTPLCIMLLDADHFKEYNDSFGHLAGDKALIEIAKTLHLSIRTYDFAARFGGDEFIILLPNTQLREAHTMAERIRSSIEKQTIYHEEGNILLKLRVSIGLVCNTQDSTVDSIFRAVDTKLYEAKQAGRNSIAY